MRDRLRRCASGRSAFLELAQVVVQDHRDGIRLVAVHVDQHVEAALGAGEHPVDRALLVHLEVVVVELFEEVAADIAPDGFFDEGQVFLVVLFAEGDAQELLEAFGDVVRRTTRLPAPG